MYVIRLAMVYALCDGTAMIDDRHVAAALAVWDDGLHGRGLHRLFHNNSRRATQTRERAIDLGVAVEIKEGDTGGRPRQRLYHRDYAPDEGRST